MRGMMMEMQPALMRHMMRRIEMGMMQGAMQSMADCPMMKMGAQEGGTAQPKGDEHEQHHQM